MTPRLVVTSGTSYTDIDAAACAIAYAAALRISGRNAIAYLPGPRNASVPDGLTQDIPTRDYVADEADNYVLVDISDFSHVAASVEIDKVVEVYDHHKGHENFWRGKPHVDMRIEPIGAAATLIWERICHLNAAGRLPVECARLVALAIASNTAGLKLPLTTDRDRMAMEAAADSAGLRLGWMRRYFDTVDRQILSDLRGALDRDTKTIVLNGGLSVIRVGQIELTDGRNLAADFPRLGIWPTGNHEMIILVSRIEDRTYVYANVQFVHDRILSGFHSRQQNDVTVIDGVVLRKMLMPLITAGDMSCERKD